MTAADHQPKGSASPITRIAFVLLLLGIGFVVGRFAVPEGDAPTTQSPPAVEASEKPTLWTCSMHPQVRLPDSKAKCPICAMDLIPLKEDGGEDLGPQCAARVKAKRTLFPDLPDPESSLVVLNANRPQPRKRIDVTVRGFAAFAQGKPPNVRLHLHLAIMSPRERREIERLARDCGAAERLRMTPADGAAVADDW